MKYEFHKGDRVVCIEPEYNVKVGELGTVRCIVGNRLAINWDKRDSFRHDCVGLCDDGHGLWFRDTKVQFYTPNEDIGDVSSSELMSLLF